MQMRSKESIYYVNLINVDYFMFNIVINESQVKPTCLRTLTVLAAPTANQAATNNTFI